jgi:hypothetical protein
MKKIILIYLFFFVCHVEIYEIERSHATFLVSLESSQWVGVQGVGFMMLGGLMQKLVIIEPFFIKN